MDQGFWLNVGLVLLFVMLGGVFAATEIALVSLRDSQLSQIAQSGKRGERVAGLARNPNRFLSAVQIGVTVAGFFSAAYGASTLAPAVSPILAGWGLPQGAASTIAFIGMTLLIAYLSLVLGELVPKRLALQRSAGLSMLVAPTLDRFANLMRPVIWLLSKSTNLIMRLLGGDPSAAREEISEEELRELVSGHEGLGEEERRIVGDVFAMGERQIREVMLPRTEVDFLEADLPVGEAVAVATNMPHSRYPVIGRTADDVVGFVHVRDLFDPRLNGRNVRLSELVRDVFFLPGTKTVLPALSEMRRAGSHIAVVVDEYGGTAGIVTFEDLIEELIGDIRDEYDAETIDDDEVGGAETDVDGLINIEDFAERTGVTLPEGPYETAAGFLTSRLGRLPGRGDAVEVEGQRLEVVEVEGRRASKLRLYVPAAVAGHPGDEDSPADEDSPGATVAEEDTPTTGNSPENPSDSALGDSSDNSADDGSDPRALAAGERTSRADQSASSQTTASASG